MPGRHSQEGCSKTADKSSYEAVICLVRAAGACPYWSPAQHTVHLQLFSSSCRLLRDCLRALRQWNARAGGSTAERRLGQPASKQAQQDCFICSAEQNVRCQLWRESTHLLL